MYHCPSVIQLYESAIYEVKCGLWAGSWEKQEDFREEEVFELGLKVVWN